MSDLDINEMLRPDGIVPIDRATTQALVRECNRLRSLLKEAGEAMDGLVMAHELPGTHCELEQAVRVACKFLSKIKGEA